MWICYYTDITNQLTTRLTLISIASARKAIPDVKVLILCPNWHPLEVVLQKAADDAIEIKDLQKHWHYDKRRCLANSELKGEALFLDTDTVIQGNIEGIFDHAFDVAVCKRDQPLEASIPYNMGVCFSRSQEFWKLVALQIPNGNHWRDSELAFSRIAMMRGEFTVKELEGRYFNKTPSTQGEDVSRAAIVHYKGQRKNWMLAREKEFIK